MSNDTQVEAHMALWKVARDAFDDYWHEDSKGIDSEAWAQAAQAVVSAITNQPACDEYFKARPQLDSAVNRGIFQAGSCAAVEASARQLAEQAGPILTITGYQLREALEFLAPDGEAEQLEQSVCIQHGPERTHEEGTDPAGLYCWLDDYPEEGSIPLTGDDARIIEATKPKQAAPGFVMVPVEPDEMWAYRVVRHYQPDLEVGEKAWLKELRAMLFWHEAIVKVAAARPLTAAPIPEQAVQRPQNCGTGFCSCIECPFDARAQKGTP